MDTNQINQTLETQTPQPDVLPTGAVTEQTPPIPPTPPVPEPPKKNWALVGGIIVLVLAVLGAGGYFAFKYYQSALLASPKPTAEAGTPTPDVTANWKTVLDTQVGISFKYPEDLLPYINTPQKAPDNLIFGFDAFNNVEKRDHRALQEADLELEIVVYKQVKWSIEPYLSAIKATDNTIVSDPFPGNSGSFIKVKTVSDGKIQKAIIYTEPKNEFAEYDAIIVDNNNNNVATIRLMTGSHNRKQELLPLLDQILSTFKFLGTVKSENILQTIQDLTQPMVWTTPQPGTGTNSAGQELSGTLMKTTFEDKAHNKLAPLLASDSALITTYGWVLVPEESGSGAGEELVALRKTVSGSTQNLIVRMKANEYTVFLSTLNK